jgi:hypothetical protein
MDLSQQLFRPCENEIFWFGSLRADLWNRMRNKTIAHLDDSCKPNFSGGDTSAPSLFLAAAVTVSADWPHER